MKKFFILILLFAAANQHAMQKEEARAKLKRLQEESNGIFIDSDSFWTMKPDKQAKRVCAGIRILHLCKLPKEKMIVQTHTLQTSDKDALAINSTILATTTLKKSRQVSIWNLKTKRLIRLIHTHNVVEDWNASDPKKFAILVDRIKDYYWLPETNIVSAY